MDKNKIIAQLLEKAKQDLDEATKTYETQKGLLQNGDMRPDSKWDTRSIEAGYLADGAAARVEELKQEVTLIEEIPKRKFKQDDEVAIGALLEIELNEQKRKYFLSPTAGGSMFNIDGEVVLVISVFSPIGDAALGLNVGDSFELELKGENREYEILSIS